MTKIDVTPIEEMHRHLCAEIATLREVNAAQAEQLRKAQERIRAAEAERDRAWNEAIEAAADSAHFFLAYGPDGVSPTEIKEWVRSLAKEAGE